MPLQADTTKAIRTVDASGNTLSTNTNDAPPIKTVDTNNREIVESEVQANEPILSVPPAQEAQEEAKGTKNPDAEARKLFLQAQRAKREADELNKRARTNLSKVEAFEKAKNLAESGEDPTALLTAAGLDPIKFYRDMTTYALSDKGKPEDPVQKELREHKERLDKYAKDLEVQAASIKEKEENAIHNQVIQQSVIPLLTANLDKYETLLMEYGANAAVEIYKTVWEIYKETGKTRGFDEVADEMEKYWSDKVEAGLNSAFKLKRFQSRFAQETKNEAQRQQLPDHQETTYRSPTLSNKHSAAPVPSNKQTRILTWEERKEAALKKFQ